MNMKEKLQERHRLLERMKDSLRDANIVCDLYEPEDLLGEGNADASVPTMLRIALSGIGKEGASGDFFFQPFATPEDVVQYFSAVLTLTDEFDETHLPALFEAISYINFHLPCGAFCIDEDKDFLSYKLPLPLPLDLSGDRMLSQMNIIAGNALSAANMYARLLFEVKDGKKSAADVAAALNTVAQ